MTAAQPVPCEEPAFTPKPSTTQSVRAWRLVLYSAIGLFVFFFPMIYQGKQSTPLDHMVTVLCTHLSAVVPWNIVALAVYGTLRGIITKTWAQGPVQFVFTILKVVGTIVGLLMVLDR